MKKEHFSSSLKVDLTDSEREKNRKITNRIVETILASLAISIFAGLGYITAIIAFIWTIGNIILVFSNPEDLFIEFLWHLVSK